ncbi:hypothetical protein F0562_018136 [Nyssa sinensis]|uniref:Uncharacterized protein n=1 Tax=Nyssa sinensis TaxID=561372 RepID=A0A5J4ZCN3_9ASTE|nr:hypothetical protein F0562_018136 [Nyssa sinensis]
MLRDWRALSCFGSRVDGEEEEEGGIGVPGVDGVRDFGVGEVVGVGAEGDLVGEMDGAGAEGDLVGEMVGGEREEVREEDRERESMMKSNGAPGAIARTRKERDALFGCRGKSDVFDYTVNCELSMFDYYDT